MLDLPGPDSPGPVSAGPGPTARGRGVRAVVIGGRVLTGVVGIAVGAATIAAASLLPLPSVVNSPASITVTPVPTSQQLICPGSVLRLGDESGENASSASAIGSPAATRAATAGGLTIADLDTPDAAGTGKGQPTLLTVPDAASAATVSIAGAQSQTVDSGDYTGFSAAECAQPSSDTWLVGGSTATGRTTLLTLANPGSGVSTVTIEIASENGIVDAPGTNGIVVAPNSQRVLSLAGFAPSFESIAVHVTSRGGPVVANLQQSIVRGIEPGGTDIVGVTAAPSTVNVVPGVVVLNAEAVEGRLGEDGYKDLGTVLRVWVPGGTPAKGTVSLIPESPDLLGASFSLTLDAGVVTDIPIEGLTDGSYTVTIVTDQPVAVAMRVSTVALDASGTVDAGASDLAWYAAATPLSNAAFASVASGAGVGLHLSNPTDAAASVTITGSDGTELSVTVPAGSSVVVEVGGGHSYRFDGAGGLFASVGYAGPAALASYLLGASATDEPPVVISPN